MNALKSEEEISGLSRLLKRLKNRMIVSNLQSTSIVSYRQEGTIGLKTL